MRSHRTLGKALLVVVATILIVSGGTFLTVRFLVLPRIADRVEREVSERCDCGVSIGSVRFLPLRWFVLHHVEAERSGAWTVTVESLSLLLDRELLKSIRAGVVPVVPGLDYRRPDLWIEEVVAKSIAAGVVPDSVSLDGIVVELYGANGTPLVARQFTFDSLDLIHPGEGDLVAIRLRSFDAGLDAALRVKTGGYPEESGSVIVKIARLELADALRYLRPGSTAAGLVTGELELTDRTDGSVELAGVMSGIDLSFAHPALSDQSIEGLDLAYRFTGTYDPDELTVWDPTAATAPGAVARVGAAEAIDAAGTLHVTQGVLELNGVEARLGFSAAGLFESISSEGHSDQGADGAPVIALPDRLVASFDLPRTDVARLLRAVPVAVSGPLAQTELEGLLGLTFQADIPFAGVSDTEWNAETELDGFAVRAIDAAMNPYILNDAFDLTIDYGGEEYTRTVRIPETVPASIEWMLTHSEHSLERIEANRGMLREQRAARPVVIPLPASNPRPPAPRDRDYTYARLDGISRWVVATTLTAEDGDFFFYGGVNPVTLADAVEINLRAGEILYGASTISMQLVKMLFLDPNRTAARKLQEVFLVYLMEHQVPVAKDRILELYLNLAEYGPGIFGIADAASRYFGVAPDELTAGEAAWLASILPSPKGYYEEFLSGSIPADGYRRMRVLFDIMLERGRMTEEEYSAAIVERPVFAALPGGDKQRPAVVWRVEAEAKSNAVFLGRSSTH